MEMYMYGDDVATMEIGDWHLETDIISSKLIYYYY